MQPESDVEILFVFLTTYVSWLCEYSDVSLFLFSVERPSHSKRKRRISVKMSHPVMVNDSYDAVCWFDPKDGEDSSPEGDCPSEEIWNKFRLLETPPRTPQHEASYPSSPQGAAGTLENLQIVSDQLSEDVLLQSPLGSSGSLSPGAWSSSGEDSRVEDYEDSCAQCGCFRSTLRLPCRRCLPLSSLLIQDCMWSGKNVPKEFFSDTNRSLSRSNSSSSTDSDKSSLVESCDALISSSDCVDPASVFPFPINDTQLRGRRSSSPSPSLSNLGAETPSDSGKFCLLLERVKERKRKTS